MEIISNLTDVLPESAYSIHCYFMSWDDIVRRNRTQACEAFPVLAGIFSGSVLARHTRWVLESFPNRDACNLKNEFYLVGKSIDSSLVESSEIRLIQDAIDKGEPLMQILSQVLHIKKSVLRHLVREKPYQTSQWWIRDPKTLLYLLDCTPPEKWPRGAEEWRLLEDVSKMLLPNVQWLLEVMRVGLKRAHSRLKALAGDLPVSYAIQNLNSVNKSIGHFRCQNNLEETSSDLRRISIFNALPLSNKWHEQVRIAFAAEAASGKQEKGLIWPTIIEEPVEIRGITFVPINNERALVNEGVMQEHCVSSYLLDCLHGTSHIFSLRSEENEILSTLQLSIDYWSEPMSIEVVEHRGKRNMPVTRRGQFMEKQFIQYLRSLPVSRFDEFDEALHESMKRLGLTDGELNWSFIVSDITKSAELTALIKTFGKDMLAEWGVQVEDPVQI